MLNEVKSAQAEQVQARRALGSYQHARRMVLAVLVLVMFVALLFGQSAFPPESVPHETIEM
ncbi:MAG: isoprenylcysteine carboxylmethyltransferase family protein, partial [Mesorhizobium sp.]